jgi:ATP-dependent Lon protease
VIEFPGYIEEEKVVIAEKFLIPRQLEQNGLTSDELVINRAILQTLIRDYTWEAGVRNLERSIGTLCRKAARRKAEGRPLAPGVTHAMLGRLLGPAEINPREAEKRDQIGAATGLAWTENGGETMAIEVLMVEGKGGVQVTGQVGEVMQESAQAAVSYIKSRARQLGATRDLREVRHPHPRVPKVPSWRRPERRHHDGDGSWPRPPARRPVRREVGMSGETVLRAGCCPSAGFEKVLAHTG